MKGLIVLAIVTLFLICGVLGLVRYREYQESIEYQEHQENQKPLTSIDSDNDGFSNKFEEQMELYDLDVPNDRYLLFCEYLPETEKELNIRFDLAYRILTEENGVLAQNITRLTGEKATRSNLQNAIEQIAEKADENDVVYMEFIGHGSCSAVACCSDNGISYSVLDEWLDEIEAKVVIVEISACKSECAASILEEGSCPRVVLTGGFSMEGFYNKETADKYPQLPTYADYGYDNPDLALDYYDMFFGFADKMTGNGDGYVSIGEFVDLLKEDVENRSKTEEWKNTTGYPWWDTARDEYGIADEIYLIEHSPNKNIFWETFNLQCL